MQKIRRIIDVLIRVERYFCCALLVAILVVCFGSVVMRYFVNKPWAWSEEVIIVLLLWFGFLCMSIETYNDTNIAITGFYKRLPEPVQRGLDLMRHVLLAVFFWLMTTNGWKIFLINKRKRLPASHWNQGLQYFPMVLGGTIMLVFSIINIVGVLTREKRQLVDEAARLDREIAISNGTIKEGSDA